MTLSQGTTPHSLNSTFASVFGFGPEATFTLSKTVEDGEALVDPIQLASIESMPIDFSGDFHLSVDRPKFSIDDRYDAIRDSGGFADPGLSPEAFYKWVFPTEAFDSYFFQLTLHRFLYRGMTDLIHRSTAPLPRSMLPYFSDDAATNVPKRGIARHAVMDVISVVLGDTVLWRRAGSPLKVAEWPAMIALFAGMISTDRIGPTVFRKALSPFRPTSVSEQVPLAIVAKLRERMSDADIFRLVSDFFPDSFIWRCFCNPTDLFKAVLNNDLVPIFPFVAVRCYISEVLAGRLTVDSALAILRQFALPSLAVSGRVVNAILKPLFTYIYDHVLTDVLPYLEMSEGQLKRIIDDVLTPMVPIMKATFGKSRDVQVSVLVRVQQLMAKRGFEPKGLCFCWYAFLYDRGIIHDTAFNAYTQGGAEHSPGKNSVLLEINSFLLTLVPGPLPDIIRDSQLPPKKPMPAVSTVPRKFNE
jgi:hypothetical protein